MLRDWRTRPCTQQLWTLDWSDEEHEAETVLTVVERLEVADKFDVLVHRRFFGVHRASEHVTAKLQLALSWKTQTGNGRDVVHRVSKLTSGGQLSVESDYYVTHSWGILGWGFRLLDVKTGLCTRQCALQREGSLAGSDPPNLTTAQRQSIRSQHVWPTQYFISNNEYERVCCSRKINQSTVKWSDEVWHEADVTFPL